MLFRGVRLFIVLAELPDKVACNAQIEETNRHRKKRRAHLPGMNHRDKNGNHDKRQHIKENPLSEKL